MAEDTPEALERNARLRREIEDQITRRFAAEDDVLRETIKAQADAGLPDIQISPIQGRLLQVLAAAGNVYKILEIGALGGYSGTWLARALPEGGKLITLEVSPKHAEVVRAAFARAGLSDRAEVRVGPADELLPALQSEAPFDMFFIDANKDGYPIYLDWALKLARPGSIIVADNNVRYGKPFQEPPPDTDNAGVAAYNQRIASDPRLRSILLPIDEDGMDGFAISVVLP
ncbi:MAG TPA: O-methyltransferase [Ktedonobacterales bacterium]|nr:O-methyltransferase [Ktedonobacterales bacterium]